MCICAVDIHTATAQQEKNMKKDIMAANLSDNKEIREARHSMQRNGSLAEELKHFFAKFEEERPQP